MPTNKKRVNLALSEDVYDRLQKYKEKNGISSDAGACLMLIIRQLDAIDTEEKLLSIVQKLPLEQLQALSNVGLAQAKQEVERNNK